MADATVDILFAHKRSQVSIQHPSGIIKSQEVITSSGFILCQHLKSHSIAGTCLCLCPMLIPYIAYR